MTDYVFDPPERPALPVFGTARRFPVHRIYGVGRNYAAHVAEMGIGVPSQMPTFFLKPADAITIGDRAIPHPPRSHDFQHEIELVVALGSGGANIARTEALGHVYGYATGIDFTRRDLQREARENGYPWDLSKSFEHCAALSIIYPVGHVGHPVSGRIWLTVNGEMRQESDLSLQLHDVASLLAELSSYVTLSAGDLIFTGTPAGVGRLKRGDQILCGIQGVAELQLRIE